jgi:hypothetical protein
MMRWLPLLLILGWGAGPGEARTLLLLPVQGELDKTSDLAAVNDLFREAVQNAFKGDVKAPRDSAHQCGEKDCALALAGAAKADEAMFSTLRRLGNKWIFSATAVDARSGEVFNQRGTALNMEDLEAVTRRVGEAVVSRQSLEKAATIDNITLKEEEQEPTRRRSLYAGGLSLGYLYPVGNSYAYLKEDFSSATTSLQEQAYRQMIKITWLNTWEFRENMILGFDLVWAAPTSIGGDLNMQYLFNRTDFTPFLGGGVGLHYVKGDDVESSDKRNSGPALNVQGGMILFRTYDIHVTARAQYHMVFNSDMDHGPSFDVGVVYQRRDKEKEGSSGWASFWKYYLLGALFVSLVTSVAGSSD